MKVIKSLDLLSKHGYVINIDKPYDMQIDDDDYILAIEDQLNLLTK